MHRIFRTFLFPAALTAVFCAGFALVVDALLTMASQVQVVGLAATSGFFGSIFSRAVLGRGKGDTD